ncbi:MAG TPA: AAA family ATPase [Candidatus Tectomicrobia bacterium]
MYLGFFNLREHPFSLTPDPRFLFLSPHHEEALSHLLYGINERKGFIEIIGEVGTGKTILCRALLDRLNGTVSAALIFNSYFTEIELLQAIVSDFGLTCEQVSRKAYIDTLNQYLLQEFAAGRNAVVLIDEAQNLEPRVLEQLRMLSNLETERGKLLQVALVGQPELRDKLATPQMRQLDQRIAVRFYMHSLTRQETQQYIMHRLSVAGAANAATFSHRALTMIYRQCAGIPRRINLLCDRALMTAYVRGTRRITTRMVRQSIRDLEGVWLPATASRTRQQPVLLRLALASIVSAAVLGFVGGWFLPSAMPQRLNGLLPEQILALMPRASPPPPWPQPTPIPPPLPDSPTLPLLQLSDSEQALMHTLWRLKTFTEGELLQSLAAPPRSWEALLPQAANTAGLDVLPWQTGVSQLSRLLRPCFMEVMPESAALPPMLWVLVKGLADQILIYQEPGGLVSVPLQRVQQVWQGKLYLTLEEGKHRSILLKQGMQGTRVQALQQVLKGLGYFTQTPSGYFDTLTLQAVKEFQRDNQLIDDGYVGWRTLIVLWHFGSPILEETT